MSTDTDPLRERIVGSALWAAYGDALGFISEMVDRAGLVQRTGSDTVKDTTAWLYRAGGRYGVPVKLPAGTYSDDTQLRLSTSRALSTGGKFDVDSFSKVELPVFLSYGLGAGKGTKASAANLARDNVSWFANFHSSADGNYIDGGGNGAAMRIQPHVWAAAQQPNHREISLNVVRNAICTHGHPRALVGALLHAYQLLRALTTASVPGPDMLLEDLRLLESFPSLMAEDDYLGRMWIPEWERKSGTQFIKAVMIVLDECREYTSLLSEVVNAMPPTSRYFEFLHRMGGYDPKTRGSGTKTAILASALAWLYRDETPDIALSASANALGSDTDTIATLAGAVLGAVYSLPPKGKILDQAALIFEADRMQDIATGKQVDAFPYPSLLEWKPPKTGVDSFGSFDTGFAVAGLGPVQVAKEEFVSKDTIWRWVTTRPGQTLLVKSRLSVVPLGRGQISTFYSSTHMPVGTISPPAPPRLRPSAKSPGRDDVHKLAYVETRPELAQKSLFGEQKTERTREYESSLEDLPLSRNDEHKPAHIETRIEPAQKSLFGQQATEKGSKDGRSLGELLLSVERSGFAPALIGRAFLEVIDGPEAEDRASSFAVMLARHYRAHRK